MVVVVFSPWEEEPFLFKIGGQSLLYDVQVLIALDQLVDTLLLLSNGDHCWCVICALHHVAPHAIHLPAASHHVVRHIERAR